VQTSVASPSMFQLREILAAECPAWATGTLILTDPEGVPVGYGFLSRTGQLLTVSASPQGVAALSQVPPAEGG
jgi:hypothetical protein